MLVDVTLESNCEPRIKRTENKIKEDRIGDGDRDQDLQQQGRNFS